MKKTIKTMMYFMVASSLILTSCGDDEDVKDAEMTLTYQGAAAIGGVPSVSGITFVGDSVKLMITGKGNSDNNLKNITVTKAVVGKSTETLYNKDLSGTDLVYNFADLTDTEDTAGVTYTFTLTSKEGNAQVKTYVTEAYIAEVTDDLATPLDLMGQTNPTDPLNFMKLTPSFTPYSITNVTKQEYAVCDMAFFYGSSNKATFGSTDDADVLGLYNFDGKETNPDWTDVARTTGFYKIPAGTVDYDAIVADGSDKALYNLASGKSFASKANMLIPGDLVLFQTQDGKLGIIEVQALNPPTGTAASNAVITLVVLAQN